MIRLNQQSYKNFIDPSIPEELILTILTNFEEEDAFYKEGLKRGMQRLEREKALRQREKELRQQEKEQAIA
ncbi:MAG: hypothetical protein ACOCXH_09380 [Cyclobacteriaceae bacterium]